MIYSLNGRVIHKNDQHAVIEIAGIGIKVFLPHHLLYRVKIGGKLFVFCYLYKEALEIYGFDKKEELEFFELLNTVSGVGPKMAMKIINGDKMERTTSVISLQDADTLSKKANISQKTASKIILELKDKVKKGKLTDYSKDDEIELALKFLGFGQKEISKIINKIPEKAKTIEEKIKFALKAMYPQAKK